MIVKLIKMHGAGNDFLFLDLLAETKAPKFRKIDIVALCDRHFGVGADGFVVLHDAPNVDAAWLFYNRDGTEAAMCGNAARCAIYMLSERHFPGEDYVISLQTKVGVIRGKVVKPEIVEITLFPKGGVALKYSEIPVTVGDSVYATYLIDTGVPHAVIEVKDILHYPIEQVGRQLVRHPAFGEGGANITFFQKFFNNEIRSATFERGVEEQTYACGTGAAAAAAVFAETYNTPLPIVVHVPGGELVVDQSPVSKLLLLRGPVKRIFELEVDVDLILDGREEMPHLFGQRAKA